jgi:DNA repair exonuclease SbcCD ATPase subunit
MAESPHLPDEVLLNVRGILDKVRAELHILAKGDAKTLHHARRYLMKRLESDERGTPAERNKVKLTLMATQQGKCPLCGEPLPPRDAELDRKDPVLGYTAENCLLIHHHCHRKAQAAKNYA